MVWIVAMRLENSVIEDRHWNVLVPSAEYGTRDAHLQPIQEVADRRKVRSNPTRQPHSPDPLLNHAEVHVNLHCS